MPFKCLLRAVRVGRPAIAPHQLQAESLSEMKLAGSQTRSPPSHFPMPAFSRQFKSSSPDTENLRTTSLSGKLRSLSWAAIVPSALFGRVTFPLSLSSVRSVCSVASVAWSWRSADCQAERLTSVQLSLLHALVAFIRRTVRVRSRRDRSEVRSIGLCGGVHSASELHRWASSGGEKMRLSAGIFAGGVLLVLPTFLSADVGSSLPSLVYLLFQPGKSSCLLAIGCVHSRDARVHWRPW